MSNATDRGMSDRPLAVAHLAYFYTIVDHFSSPGRTCDIHRCLQVSNLPSKASALVTRPKVAAVYQNYCVHASYLPAATAAVQDSSLLSRRTLRQRSKHHNMATDRKAILSMGLGRFAANDPNAMANFGPNTAAVVKEKLQNSIRQANAAGFDVVQEDCDPQDPDGTVRRFVNALKDREDIVGLNIGFGVRGHKYVASKYPNKLVDLLIGS
jgi:hypothetical protein